MKSGGSVNNYYAYYTRDIGFGFCIDTPAFTTEANATNITVQVSPNAVGPAGTTYQYQINEGAWQNAGLTTDTTHTFTGLTPETQYTVNVKIGNEVQTAQTVTTTEQKTMKQVSTVADAIKYSATAISADDTSYSGTYKELTDSTGATVKVPVGFTVRYDSAKNVDEGIVVTDGNDNQWVWIPVNASNPYTRTAYKGESLEDVYTHETNDGYYSGTHYWEGNTYYYYEAPPVSTDIDYNLASTAGGFYIGRYEAGSEEDTENETMRTAVSAPRTVTIKKNQVPYNCISLTGNTGAETKNCETLSSEIAEANGYKTGIITKLCSSYAWDTTINFINDSSWSTGTGSDYSSVKQNYKNSASFKALKIVDGSIQEINTTPGTSDEALLTGQGDATKNIYDMGGNCFEYVTEHYSKDNITCVNRGGGYNQDFSSRPAGARYYGSGVGSAKTIAFRPTLYV